MKKFFIVLTSLFLVGTTYSQDNLPIDILVDALIQVESNGDTFAIGDGGRAVGVLQIHPIMVREVNRILEKKGFERSYTYNDRYDYNKSIEMFYIWKDYYHRNSSYEKIARCWNGGPRGHLMGCTKHYWYKVSYRIDQLAWAN